MCSTPPFYKLFVIVDVPDETDGESLQILEGNCTCKEGQTQSCVHLFPLLILAFFLEEQSCTSKPCHWVRPCFRRVFSQPILQLSDTPLFYVRVGSLSYSTLIDIKPKLPYQKTRRAGSLKSAFCRSAYP